MDLYPFLYAKPHYMIIKSVRTAINHGSPLSFLYLPNISKYLHNLGMLLGTTFLYFLSFILSTSVSHLHFSLSLILSVSLFMSLSLCLSLSHSLFLSLSLTFSLSLSLPLSVSLCESLSISLPFL